MVGRTFTPCADSGRIAAMTRLKEFLKSADELAPLKWAESWDNVGLLAGDPEQSISHALLTIDYTREVADEAKSLGCDLVIAYHPPLFKPVSRLLAGDVVYDAIRRGVAIYSPHTALDVAAGGTNDLLADVLELEDRRPLKLSVSADSQCKLVTFVPKDAAERVSQALFEAGAGRIGDYSSCSFQTDGRGTFLGDPEKTTPAVGASGRLERVEEVKIETVAPNAKLPEIVAALRKSHPYEEPAFDLVRLAPPPEGMGIGRVGRLAQPTPRRELFERVRRGLNVEHMLVAGPIDGDVSRAAVCAGSCGDLLNEAMAHGAALYLTGEMRHHDALRAARAGVTVICVLHSNSERAVLPRWAARLGEALPDMKFSVSRLDRDPFMIH